MSEQQLEEALRRALRAADPGDDFADRVMARLPPARPRGSERRRALTGWTPVAIAACLLASAVGVVRFRQAALQAQRAQQARAQLLQALSIASANVNAVRAVVIREEQPLR